MRREDLTELHYITPIENLASILKWGIQSHHRISKASEAGKIRYASIALPEVQDKREKVRVPGGKPLHEYANLYLCARNPMMFKRKEQHAEICVLRIDLSVLDIENAIVVDRNAASSKPLFKPAPQGLEYIDGALVFAEDWRHPDAPLDYQNHKAVKCAEVLIPDKVPPNYITGVYVSCEEVRLRVQRMAESLEVTVNAHLFFLQGPQWFEY